ncbi:MAG: hypothetical protein QOE90_3287 [Thermoplasmata archaeon]|jgi:phosphate uptake regulator|nr:hypothetical protein [Thermoplasmata archaeon]
MELRKIQLTGGSSYTVTLPKDWVDQAQMGAGDVVGFNPQADGSLAVYPHARFRAQQAKYEAELTAEDPDASFRTIVGAYLNGYDVIVIRSKKALSPATRRAVRQASKRIIGIQVTEEDSHSITLQDFMDPKEFHIDKGLRRMQTLARNMQEDALKLFNEKMDDFAAVFGERDDEVDSLFWMVNKQYHAILRDPAYAQKMGLNANQALNYLLCARLIERTADHATRLAENIDALRNDKVQQKLESRLEKQARKAVSLFADALAAFHKQDLGAANKIIAEAHAFKTTQESVMKESLSLGGESMLHVALALESIGRTAAYAADVAETAINHRVAMAA